uniref:Uncharacterized protein n=1 Tax=Utricularia reniformis TaxID=192314 RepID=A0A1Y0B4C8_9LAMI|nr:hypothetical protein AEK19_MT2119 [Utricularia reniformis]ART32271.1 hypothetical protein AEK19_MT2119 [Utricularia reniformis]
MHYEPTLKCRRRLSTVTRCSILLRLCTAFDRDGKSSLHLSTQHPSLTFIALRASRFA